MQYLLKIDNNQFQGCQASQGSGGEPYPAGGHSGWTEEEAPGCCLWDVWADWYS